jgi:hypothetical protein
MSTGILKNGASPITVVIAAAFSYKRNHGVDPCCICISEELRWACELWAENNIPMRQSEPSLRQSASSNKFSIGGFTVFVLDSFTGMKAEGAGIAE